MSDKKPTTDVIELTKHASDLSDQMESLIDGINLTENSVKRFRSTVGLLQQTHDRLNEIYAILNTLPSSLKPQYDKADPNGRRSY